MIKLIKRMLLLTVVLTVGFMVFSIKSGGEGFRSAGEAVKAGTEEIAQTADLIKESSENIKRTATEATTSLRRTGGQIKVTTQKASDAFSTVKKTVLGTQEPENTNSTEKALSESPSH